MSTNLSSLITNSIPGAQGEKNYLATGASTSQGWTASGAGITVGTDTTAINLPRPNTTLTGIKFTGVSGSTAYAYYRFILDDADVGKTLKVQFDMKPGTAVSSDFKVDVYSFTASDYSTGSARVSLSTDSSAVTAIPAATGTFKSSFTGPAITSKWIEVRIGLNAAAAHTLYVSDFIVGPGVVQQGAAVTESQIYTLSITGSTSNPTKATTPAFDKATWRRVGDSMEIQYEYCHISNTGAAAGSGSYIFSIPSGFTIDIAKISAAGGIASVGSAYASNASTEYTGSVIPWDQTHLALLLFTSISVSNYASSSNASLSATTCRFGFTARVPIAEWSGSGTVNIAQNDVEYVSNSSTTNADDTTSFAYGSGGSLLPVALSASHSKRIRFQTPIQATDQLIMEYRRSSSVAWAPINSNGEGGFGWQQQNATTYGVNLAPVSATDVDVNFARYALPNGATYGAAGAAWSDFTGYWRVRKVSGGQAVGFATATNTIRGLVLDPKQYVVATAYTNGTPAITCPQAGFAITRGVLIPYQTSDGAWRMKFNFGATFTSATTSGLAITFSGVTFKNVTNYNQPLTLAYLGVAAMGRCYVNPNSGQINTDTSTGAGVASVTGVQVSGDVELESKPTWAD